MTWGMIAIMAAAVALACAIDARGTLRRIRRLMSSFIAGPKVPGAGSEPDEKMSRAARYARDALGGDR